MLRRVAAVIFISAALVTASANAQGPGRCLTRLWGNAKITPPADDVGAPLKRWSGLWGNGRWDGVLCNSVAVLEVRKDGSAKVQYAWGNAPRWQVRPGAIIVNAEVSADMLTFGANGARITYRMAGDQINGSYTNPYGSNVQTTLERAK